MCLLGVRNLRGAHQQEGGLPGQGGVGGGVGGRSALRGQVGRPRSHSWSAPGAQRPLPPAHAAAAYLRRHGAGPGRGAAWRSSPVPRHLVGGIGDSAPVCGAAWQGWAAALGWGEWWARGLGSEDRASMVRFFRAGSHRQPCAFRPPSARILSPSITADWMAQGAGGHMSWQSEGGRTGLPGGEYAWGTAGAMPGRRGWPAGGSGRPPSPAPPSRRAAIPVVQGGARLQLRLADRCASCGPASASGTTEGRKRRGWWPAGAGLSIVWALPHNQRRVLRPAQQRCC